MVLCAIGRYLCFALRVVPPCFPQGSTCLVVLRILLVPFRFSFSITRLSPSMAGFPKTLLLSFSSLLQFNPGSHAIRFRLFPFARRYSENRCFFLFLRVLRCFSSGFPFHTLCIGAWMTEVCSAGFPHSEICGSRNICFSPQLIAACHVFLRLLVPRHPPCTLISLT